MTEYTVFGFQPLEGRISSLERPHLTFGIPLRGLIKTRSAKSFAPMGVSLMTSSNCNTMAFSFAPTAAFSGVTFSNMGGARSGAPPGGAP